MNYLQFDFFLENREEFEMLLALLAAQGFEGFEEKDDTLYAFVEDSNFNEDTFSLAIARFDKLSYVKTIVENINWNKIWEADFKPVLIGNFVAIRAGFHPPINTVSHEIIITPKMSFGTGHHATTELMIRQMEKLDFFEKSVLDFGTGTGILAILAIKLGAGSVVAVDYDEWSIANAHENMEQNNCSNILVKQSDTLPERESFDIILANINLNVIIFSLSAIVKCSLPSTLILLSGFLKEDEEILVNALQEAGLKYLSTMQSGDWIAVMAEKR